MYDSLGSVGILNAGATSNSNINVDTQGDIPCACPSNWLIAVTSTSNTDTKPSAGFGNTTIDLGAPGTNIVSTGLTNSYTALSGTSFASPHVAGAIALMYSVYCSQLMVDCKNNPAGVAQMMKDSLLATVDTIPALNGKTVSGGRLNLYKSVKSIQNHYFSDYCPPSSISTYDKPKLLFEILNTYPNPATNTLNMEYYSNVSCEISIVDIWGQEVKTIPLNNNLKDFQEITINLNDVEQGVYFLSLRTKNTHSNVVKLIVY